MYYQNIFHAQCHVSKATSILQKEHLLYEGVIMTPGGPSLGLLVVLVSLYV